MGRRLGLFWGLVGFISALVAITSLTVALFVLGGGVGEGRPLKLQPPFDGRNLIPSLVLPVGVAVLIGYAFSRRFTRPMVELSEAAERLSSGDLSVRVQLQSPFPELQMTANTFNKVAGSLEHLEAERRQMIADIAHELRNPLTAMRLRLEALEDGVAELTKQEVSRLQAQLSLLSRLVEDLQTLSLADTGQLALRIQDFDLKAKLENIIELLQPRATEKNVSLSLLPLSYSELPIPFRADPDRLAQVMINLIENAIRHTSQGGTVTVELEASNGQTHIRVKDSGEGIPPEALPKLFSRFYRVDSSRSRNTGGSGLGLAIVKVLVELHGGQIEAENAPNGGAIFSVKLSNQP